MDFSNRLRNQKEQLKETLWGLEKRFQSLQNYRKSINSFWQDDAATELNQRYFRPHEADGEGSIRALDRQVAAIEEADEVLKVAIALEKEANRLSLEVEKFINFADQDIARGHSEYDVYKEQNSLALAELPRIAQLIHNANNSCG